MDDPNITMEEYIRIEEEKARRHGQMFNWQTATFGKVKNYEDEDDCSIDFETEFPAIVFDNTLTTIPSEPTVCPPNENKVDFRISLEESDDEDNLATGCMNPYQISIYDITIVTIIPPKRTSTSKAPAMTQAAIKKLIADSVFAALEAQAANMANTVENRFAHLGLVLQIILNTQRNNNKNNITKQGFNRTLKPSLYLIRINEATPTI
ncbi:hypothetical protein Tco_0478617 [Tanacetum coccineum]